MADFAVHLPQRNRCTALTSVTKPSAFSASCPVIVRAAPQLVHSTFNPQLNRMRSPVVRTILFDMPPDYASENKLRTLVR